MGQHGLPPEQQDSFDSPISADSAGYLLRSSDDNVSI